MLFMKRITMLLLLLVSASQAQPVLTAPIFPTEYSVSVYRGSTVGFTNGSAGANQVWDYSQIITELSGLTMTVIPLATMPFLEEFPNASYCQKWSESGSTYYDVYNLNNNTFESIGFADENSYLRYSDTNLIFQFPYTFNTISTDTFLEDRPGSTADSQTRTYDAFGTLITPFGSFPDVIRQKLESNGSVSYTWFDSRTYQVILGGNFDNSEVYFFKETTNLGISKNENQDFSIYPNPTNDVFTIYNQNNLNHALVNVYDVSGKALITNEKFNSDYKNISLKDLSSGLYIVKITDNENQVLYNQKIIKN